MKNSNYNITIFYNNEILLFNTISNSLFLIPEYFLDKSNKISIKKLESEEKKKLFSKGFLVKKAVNEFNILKQHHLKTTQFQNQLVLTILPTLDCNAKCYYCFQPNKNIYMADSTIEQLVSYIKEKLKHIPNLHINWFGGEPTLKEGIHIIQKIQNRLYDLRKELSFSYSSSVVTNGINANLTNVNKISNLKSIQFTLDGHRDYHNKVKGLKCFNTIVTNITSLLETKIFVSLRINVSQNNIQSVEKLIEMLSKKNIYRKLFISFAPIDYLND